MKRLHLKDAIWDTEAMIDYLISRYWFRLAEGLKNAQQSNRPTIGTSI